MSIPKIIHKIWFNFKGTIKGSEPSQEFIKNEKECTRLNNDYQLMTWDENQADEFMRTNYPNFYPYFVKYPKKIQKVDSFRYFLLYHFGGIYLDMDIVCNKPFVEYNFENTVNLVEDNSGVYLNPIKLNNFIMVSPRGHPFWLHVINYLISNYEKKWWQTDFWYVLYSTGPGMLTQAYESYPSKSSIKILNSEQFNPCNPCGCTSSRDSFIRHTYAAEWTSRADDVLKGFYCHGSELIGIALLIVLIGLFVYNRRLIF